MSGASVKNPSPQPVLAAKNVSRQFLTTVGALGARATLKAVTDVSFSLGKGESLGLVGESGCGKSTLGRLACGLMPPTSGAILLDGQPLGLARSGNPATGRVQMIFQDPGSSLDPRARIIDSVAEPLLGDLARREAREKAAELLALVGLSGMGQRYPHQFSGGQRQRVAIARAIGARPEAIVCDEPVSALDASVQAQILNLLKDMRAEFEPAYLFISHDLSVIGFMCERVMVMYLGQIVEEGMRDELFARPGHPYTRALLAAMPGERGKKGERMFGRVPVLTGELPNPIKPPSGCHFHPRCPKAEKICAIEAPDWHDLGAGWRARCHFPG